MGHLFNKKEPQQEGDSIPFDDTLRRLLGKLALFHTVARSTPEVPAPLLASPVASHGLLADSTSDKGKCPVICHSILLHCAPVEARIGIPELCLDTVLICRECLAQMSLLAITSIHQY